MNYVLSYQGGGGMPESEAEAAEIMAAWGAWFDKLGPAMVDGGNPFGAAKTVSADGSTEDGGVLTGYSIISADSLDQAVEAAKACPVLASGGQVEVSETIQM